MSHKSNTKFPFKTVYFERVRGLTASSYIVYNYTISGYLDLWSVSTVYTVSVHFYTNYLFITNAIKM